MKRGGLRLSGVDISLYVTYYTPTDYREAEWAVKDHSKGTPERAILLAYHPTGSLLWRLT